MFFSPYGSFSNQPIMNALTKFRCGAAAWVLGLAFFSQSQSKAADDPSLAKNVPGGAFAYVEATELDEIIQSVRGSEILNTILKSEDYARANNKGWFQEMVSSKKMAEMVLRMTLWEACAKLLGGRVGFAFYPAEDGGDPEVALLVRPSEPSEWLKKRVWSAPLIRVGLKRVERIAFGSEVAAYRTRGDKGKATYFALHNDWVAASSDIELLKKTVVLQGPEKTRLGDAGPKLGDEIAYQRMTKRMGTAHFGRAFIDTQRVAKIAKTAGPNFGVPEAKNDPMLSLFLGGVSELLDNSRFAGFVLDLEGKQVRFSAGIDARPKDVDERYRLFFSDNPSTGMAPLPIVKGHIGGFTLYRQFGDWYRKRDAVLKDSLIPGVEGFQGDIGDILLGKAGAKGESIIGDKVAFVAAMRDDAGAEEGNGAALPGFAFVVDLAKTEGVDAEIGKIFDAVLDEIRLSNDKKIKWVHGEETHSGVTVKYATAKSGGRTLVPAIARVDDRLIVSSSRLLSRDLIAVLQKPNRGLIKGKDLIFDLHSAPLQSLLKTNRENYRAQLLRDGRSARQADDDLKNIENMIELFTSLEGSTTAANGIFEINVRGRLR